MVGKKPLKSMTLDKLATLVQGGFIDIDAKFKEVYEKMDKGFEGVNDRLDTIDRRLDHLADDYGHRLKQVEKKVGIA